MNLRISLVLVPCALLGAFGLTAASVPASAAAPLKCHAWMSNAHPADYSYTAVRVQTASDAGVTTVAHYKTLNRRHTGSAGAGGSATIRYYISGATPGYRVTVSVTTKHANRYGFCSTSFVPHRG
ncbi:MAG TPA: hypothetical protein VGG16_01375 [Streptosporangiaceae bacterium]